MNIERFLYQQRISHAAKKTGVVLLMIFVMGLLIVGLWMALSWSDSDQEDAGLTEPTESIALATGPQLTIEAPDQVAEDQSLGTMQAVADRDGEIYLIQGDQVESFYVSSENIFYPPPVLSPDGTRIAYRNLDGYLTLYEISSQETIVYSDVDINGFWRIGWSPDGYQVAYSKSTAPAEICIYTLVTKQNVCFSDLENDPVGSFGGFSFAGWSRDGGKMGLLLNSQPQTSSEGGRTYLIGTIYVLDLAEDSVTEVITEESFPEIEQISGAMLSPDGETFLFSARSGDFVAVFLVNTDGTGLTRITPESLEVDVMDPIWRPDGQGFVAQMPALDGNGQEVVLVPTVFDLSGQIIDQILITGGGHIGTWIEPHK